MNGTVAYVLANKNIYNTTIALGNLKGASCVIKSITQQTNGDNHVVFEWTANDGVTKVDNSASPMVVPAGVSVVQADPVDDTHFRWKFSDGTYSQSIEYPKQIIQISAKDGNALVKIDASTPGASPSEYGYYVSKTGVVLDTAKGDNLLELTSGTGGGYYVGPDANKVDVDQTVANAGKVLVVGANGKVTVDDVKMKVSTKAANAIREITDAGDEGIYTSTSPATGNDLSLKTATGEEGFYVNIPVKEIDIDSTALTPDTNGVVNVVLNTDANNILSYTATDGLLAKPIISGKDGNAAKLISNPTTPSENGIYVEASGNPVSGKNENKLKTISGSANPSDDGLMVDAADFVSGKDGNDLQLLTGQIPSTDDGLYVNVDDKFILEYYELDTTGMAPGAKIVVASGTVSDPDTEIDIDDVTPVMPFGTTINTGDYVVFVDKTTSTTSKYVKTSDVDVDVLKEFNVKVNGTTGDDELYFDTDKLALDKDVIKTIKIDSTTISANAGVVTLPINTDANNILEYDTTNGYLSAVPKISTATGNSIVLKTDTGAEGLYVGGINVASALVLEYYELDATGTDPKAKTIVADGTITDPTTEIELKDVKPVWPKGTTVNVGDKVIFVDKDTSTIGKYVEVMDFNNEGTNLTYDKIFDSSATPTTEYKGDDELEVTSEYLFKQFEIVIPTILDKIDDVFDLTQHISYITYDTKAELDADDLTAYTEGVVLFLVKQDESRPARDDGTLYTTIYIYIPSSGATAPSFVAQLNMSEKLIKSIIVDAIRQAICLEYYTVVPSGTADALEVIEDTDPEADGYIRKSLVTPVVPAATVNVGDFVTFTSYKTSTISKFVNRSEIDVSLLAKLSSDDDGYLLFDSTKLAKDSEKLSITTSTINAGKAVVVDVNGNLVFGEANTDTYLSQADYDTLPATKLTDNITYFVEKD